VSTGIDELPVGFGEMEQHENLSNHDGKSFAFKGHQEILINRLCLKAIADLRSVPKLRLEQNWEQNEEGESRSMCLRRYGIFGGPTQVLDGGT
jgi:hypothetical protein